MSGHLQRGLTAESAARFLAVEACAVAEEARWRHGLNRGASRVLGEAMVAALMMAAYLKGDERITLQIQAEQPRLGLSVDVTAAGEIRAQLRPPAVQVPTHGQLRGVMVVIKHNAQKELYRGATAIEEESLAAALGRHLRESSQVGAIIRLVCEVGADGAVVQAGGLLVERLPPAEGLPTLSAEAFEAHYGDVRGMSGAAVAAVVRADGGGELLGAPLAVMEQRPVIWRCRCSQERVEGMLAGLGADELRSMIEEDGGAEVTCHFCQERYVVDEARLRALLSAAS